MHVPFLFAFGQTCGSARVYALGVPPMEPRVKNVRFGGSPHGAANQKCKITPVTAGRPY